MQPIVADNRCRQSLLPIAAANRFCQSLPPIAAANRWCQSLVPIAGASQCRQSQQLIGIPCHQSLVLVQLWTLLTLTLWLTTTHFTSLVTVWANCRQHFHHQTLWSSTLIVFNLFSKRSAGLGHSLTLSTIHLIYSENWEKKLNTVQLSITYRAYDSSLQSNMEFFQTRSIYVQRVYDSVRWYTAMVIFFTKFSMFL